MKGAIIGDIVGSIYEFDNLKSKDFELFKPECEFTDDSVLTVAVAEALLKYNPDDEENFKENLIDIFTNTANCILMLDMADTIYYG